MKDKFNVQVQKKKRFNKKVIIEPSFIKKKKKTNENPKQPPLTLYFGEYQRVSDEGSVISHER